MFNYKKTYLSSEFARIVEFLKQDRKKFIVFLDDLRGADILDIYIHRKGSLPNSKDLQNLEKNLFKKTTNWRKKDIGSVKKYFLENNIKFTTRSSYGKYPYTNDPTLGTDVYIRRRKKNENYGT